MLESLLRFRRERHLAYEAFRAGQRDTRFPPGSWFPWRYFGVHRAPGVAVALAAPS
jgi:hypothetical protein